MTNSASTELRLLLETLPTFEQGEMALLKSFFVAPTTASRSELTSILTRSRETLLQFQKQSKLLEKALLEQTIHWEIQAPFDFTTKRPFIPRMEQLSQLLLLQSAFYFEEAQWSQACENLYLSHLASRLLSIEPVLFAQIGACSIESQSLQIWAHYMTRCPMEEFVSFLSRRSQLPNLPDGTQTLNYDHQAALYLNSQYILPEGALLGAAQLTKMLHELKAQIPPDQIDKDLVLPKLSELTRQIEFVEAKYKMLKVDFKLPYLDALKKLQETSLNHQASTAVEASFNFNYLPFLRKIYETKTQQAMCSAGEAWVKEELEKANSFTSLPLSPFHLAVVDPRTQKKLRAEILTSKESKHILRISTSNSTDSPHVRNLHLDFPLP